MKVVILTAMFATLISCQQTQNFNEVIEKIDDYNQIEQIINGFESEVVLVNFWATTCPPCLKEMPHFRELADNNSTAELKVLLVSTDEADDHDRRVIPFVKKHKITPEVLHLTDDNYSAWTAKVDKSWYGALPATMILYKGKKTFKFGAYKSLEEIESDIAKLKR